MLTQNLAFLLGAAAIVVVLALVEAVARIRGGSFLTSVVIGEDNRTSTSKTFLFVWTLLVGWALFTLVIVGEVIRGHACASGSDLTTAITMCKSAHDGVGLLQIGWKQFTTSGLSNAYLVLLGIPAATAVGAKAITQSRADSGAVVKTTHPTAKQGVVQRLAQIFSADDQTTDIGDFQYLVFNLITAAFFVAGFLQVTGQGLPTIPDTLLGLTSVSAATYVGKKAATRTQPTITGVFPSTLRNGITFTVTGNGLTVDPAAPTPPGGLAAPEITIDGVAAINVIAVGDHLTGKVPANLVPPGQTPSACSVQVKTAYQAVTPMYNNVQCA